MSSHEPRRGSLSPLNRPPLSFSDLKKAAVPVIFTIGVIFLSGFTMIAKYLALALLFFGIWLYLVLQPSIDWISVAAVNRIARFRRSYRAENAEQYQATMATLIVDREQTVKRHSRSFKLILAVVILGFTAVGSMRFFSNQHERERQEASNDIKTTDAVPSEEDLKAGEVTFRNLGKQDIFLHSFTCLAASLNTTHNNVFNIDRHVELGELRLVRGGDGQSFPCEPAIKDDTGGLGVVDCADVKWTISFTLADRRDDEVTKSVRYFLRPGHKVWEQVSLGSTPLHCEREHHG